ncbi:acyl-CoA carboxylase epsilon subunit [Streptomyces sp. NPDC050145]|uniref:acyl-CoA carboxylase epsilon subunit n=1 Tax=Streptomyces sp. NPDC050145 TaxID=3365602 RepID=UPI003794BCA9
MSGMDVVLRVTRGRARDEELAALAAVFLAMRGDGAEGRGTRSEADRARWKRPEGYVAPGSWR